MKTEAPELPDYFREYIGNNLNQVVVLNVKMITAVDHYQSMLPGRLRRLQLLKLHNRLNELDKIGQPFSFTLYLLARFGLSLSIDDTHEISQAYNLRIM